MAKLSIQTVEVADPAEERVSFLPHYRLRPWWYQAFYYVVAGLRICRKDLPGLITLVGLFLLPPLGAVIVGSQPGTLAYWVASALPWVTITLGNITIVLAIEAIDAGQPVIPARILPAAVRWFPRYIWTNGITTFLFWGLFNPLQWAIGQETNRLNWPSSAPLALLLLPMLVWHVHLVFATYAAIVDDHPGIRSVLISIGVTRRRWIMVAAAFAGSVIVEGPIVGPLYFLILKLANPLVAGGFTWMLIMLMRPIFIATLHEIYEDFRPAPAFTASSKRTYVLKQEQVCIHEPPCDCCVRNGRHNGNYEAFAELAPVAAKRDQR